MESWALESGIQLKESGIRNPESKFHPTKTVKFSAWNRKSTEWNPESKTVLDFPTWGEKQTIIVLIGPFLVKFLGSWVVLM